MGHCPRALPWMGWGCLGSGGQAAAHHSCEAVSWGKGPVDIAAPACSSGMRQRAAVPSAACVQGAGQGPEAQLDRGRRGHRGSSCARLHWRRPRSARACSEHALPAARDLQSQGAPATPGGSTMPHGCERVPALEHASHRTPVLCIPVGALACIARGASQLPGWPAGDSSCPSGMPVRHNAISACGPAAGGSTAHRRRCAIHRAGTSVMSLCAAGDSG